jgi:hypothetical protein
LLTRNRGEAPDLQKGTVLDDDVIRFSQRNVRKNLYTRVASMRKRGWQEDPIDVVRMPDGVFTSVDNTRLLAARLTGTRVHANIHNFSDPIGDQAERLSNKYGVPKTWGDAVNLRIKNQGAAFRNRYPMGAPFTGDR